MEQNSYWQQKWTKIKRIPVNSFAKQSYKLMKGSKTLLDLGCGGGQDTFYFAKKGLKVTAFDFSENGLCIVRDKLKKLKLSNVTPKCGNIQNINFPNNHFDIIYAHLSLHYFDDKTTTKIFNKLHKMLKKNGIIFIKCKSTDDERYGKGKKIEKNMYFFKGHVRHFFDKEYMAEKLKSFKIIKIKKTSSKYYSYKASFIKAVAKK